MKKLLVVVLVPLAVLAAVGAIAYVLLIGPIFALPVGVAVAESALATDDLVLLAGLNVKHMTFLERWFLGRPAISVTNGRPLPEAADRRCPLSEVCGGVGKFVSALRAIV